MTPIAIDFESFYSKKLKYGLVQMIPEQYCAHELFDPYLISVSDGSQSWSGSPKDFNWEALRGRVLLSHNRRFDNTVYNEMVTRGWAPQVNPKAWQCTANLTSYLCNRRALQQSVEHLFGHRVSKDYRAITDSKNWPNDYTEGERQQCMDAGKADALWCWRLWDKFSPQWPAVEQELSRITIDQGMYGVRIDREKLDQYLYQSHEMRANAEKQIPWLTAVEEDDFNPWEEFNTKPTSTKCIAEQCRRAGIPCPPVKSDDEDEYLAWETTYAPGHPWILAVGEWRSINKLYRTFQTIKERLRPDGTLPFSTKYFGAHTGRWSGDSRVNMQNQRRRPIVCNDAGLLELDDKRVDAGLTEEEDTGKRPAWMRYVIDFRSLIVPRPGMKMIVSDLAQIEPRVLAWITGDTATLDQVRAGCSMYVAHARANMGFTGETMDKNSTLYKLAKARVLGLGYGCGWMKFISMAQDLARLDITADDPEWIEVEDPFTNAKTRESGWGFTSKKIVKEFRDQNTKITDLWKRLGAMFNASVGGDFCMTLPSGRKMRYEQVRRSERIVKDRLTGKPKRESVYTADIGGRRKPFYGGKLCENLIQAAARDVFATQVADMDRQGLRSLFTVHDEAVLEVATSVSIKDIEHEMSKCPDWLAGCPISAEAKEVTCYCK